MATRYVNALTQISIWSAIVEKNVRALHQILVGDGFELLCLFEINDAMHTPLRWAAFNGSWECVCLILEFMLGVACDACKDCLLRIVDASKIIPRHGCPMKPRADVADDEMENDAGKSGMAAARPATWTYRNSCMMTCFKKKQRCNRVCFIYPLNRSCLRHYSNIIDSIDREQNTALLLAIISGQPRIAETLLAAGIVPNVPAKEGMPAAIFAERMGHAEIVQRLVEVLEVTYEDLQIHFGIRGMSFKRNITLAACAEATENLIEHPYTPENRLGDLLEIAAHNGDSLLLLSLLNITDEFPGCGHTSFLNTGGQNLLLVAAASPNLTAGTVSLLLDRGYDPNFEDYNAETALLLISELDIQDGDEKFQNDVIMRIQKLLTAGASVNLCSPDDGDSVLIRDSSHPNYARQSSFLRAGINVNAVNFHKESALTNPWPLDTSKKQYSQALVEAGADINYANSVGNTALFEAISRFDVELMRYLIEQGADVNCTNNFSATPLIHLVSHEGCDPRLLDVLLDGGAKMTGQEIFRIFYFTEDDRKIEMLKALLLRGAAPVMVSLSNVKFKIPRVTFRYSVLTPRAAARRARCLRTALFMDYIWFDTSYDLYGRVWEKLKALRSSRKCNRLLIQKELANYRPAPLIRLSFMVLTANLGGCGPDRLKRIDQLPIPDSVKDKLKFKLWPRE